MKKKVITICSSLKFEDKIKEITERLELEGNCVLSLVYPVGRDKDDYTEEEIQNLNDAHYQKIDMSDTIFVVNVGGYIGESVKKEIEYAKSHNKEIMYLEIV